MLSYRHSFHAGNFADVLKHVVVTEILAYLCLKDKPFEYIDTHAGAGIYSLASKEARKTGEYLNGIARLVERDWAEIAAYLEVVRAHNPRGGLRHYPGSPAIALSYLRPQDRAWLFELHPGDHAALCRFTEAQRKVTVRDEDGLAGLLALVPPVARRALVLVDPSYEVKSEYQQVASAVIAAHRKFATGIYAVWYPVISRRQAQWFEQQFRRAGIRDIQVFELAVARDDEDFGMTSSCMLVINPPWSLRDKMASVLPALACTLAVRDGEAFSRVEVLADE